MTRVFLPLLVLLTAGCTAPHDMCCANYEIEVLVIDASSELPIPGAEVVLELINANIMGRDAGEFLDTRQEFADTTGDDGIARPHLRHLFFCPPVSDEDPFEPADVYGEDLLVRVQQPNEEEVLEIALNAGEVAMGELYDVQILTISDPLIGGPLECSDQQRTTNQPASGRFHKGPEPDTAIAGCE